MFKIYCITSSVLFTIACSSNGKDGATGVPGKDGVDGVSGERGLPGSDGKDGTDNHFVASIRCSGVPTNGPLQGRNIEYVAFITVAGDTFATAEVRAGNFTQSATRFYGASQIGAKTATVFVPLDNTDDVQISVNRLTSVTTVKYLGSSFWEGTFGATACTAQTYEKNLTNP